MSAQELGGEMSDAVMDVHMRQVLGAVEGMRTDFKPVSDLVLRHDERIDTLTRGQAELNERQAELSERLSNSLEWLIKNPRAVAKPEIEKKHVAYAGGLGVALTALAEILRIVITT